MANSSKWRGRGAALTLTVLTPISAELSLGNPPLRMASLLLLWIPIYGAGTLLIRELVRRGRGGWPSILLYGIAYGIIEEGIVLQALSSPTMYGAADWAPRILGLNSAYTELNLPYHAVFSVAIPILVNDLLFPDLRRSPYLGRFGLGMAAVVFALGALLLRVSTTPYLDHGYQAPPLLLVAYVVVIGALVVGARLLRSRPPGGTVEVRPVLVGITGGVAAFAYLALLFPFGGASQPAFTHGAWVALPMIAALLLLAGVAVLLRRWAWTDRHSLALAISALAGHTVFGLLANAHTLVDRASLAALGVVMMVLLTRIRTTDVSSGA